MANKKFSQFTAGGESKFGDQIVGLRSGVNSKFDFPGLGIRDFNGNYMLQYATAGAASINYPLLINSVSGNAVIYTAQGTDTDIDLSVQPKNNGSLILDELTWPNSPPSADTSFIFANIDGTMGYSSGIVVTDITGTNNQVLVNGTFGIPQTGSVVLTTPQDIATTSSPTFSSLTLTNPLTLSNGGTSKALTANAGGIVWTDSDSMEVLAGTATAFQMLQSGNLATPTWSTTTWPATTTINQLLYSSAANTVSGLSSANSSGLVTNSTGVPVWTSSLTNGQIIIGSTGATPIPATLSAGSGVTILNSPNSITISSTGGGMSWTEVTGTSQAMSADNGYIANNAGLVTLTLPVTAALGTSISVCWKGAGGWTIAQNAGQSIRVGTSISTVGVGGSISSSAAGNSINLICITANTVWEASGAPQGIITVV